MDTRDFELLNKLHLATMHRARETNQESDWQDAQAIDHLIQDYKKINEYYKRIGHELGALEGLVSMLINGGNLSDGLTVLKEMNPELYERLKVKSGHA